MNRIFIKTATVFAVSALIAVSCGKKEEAAAPAELTINDPWVLEVPAERPMTAAFMVIKGGSEDDALIAAEGSVSKVTEIHDMVTENEVMKMRKIERIDIPAGGEAELKRGSKHIMLIDLINPLKEGDSVELTLTFEKAGKKVITAPVKKADIQNMDKMEHKH